MLFTGRKKIYTDEPYIDESNILKVLGKAYGKHRQVSAEIQALFAYEAGIQPLKREKKVRPEIDIRITDNVANYVKKFNLGYFWSNPIMLVQRGTNEIHGTKGTVDSIGITALNEMLKNAENIGYKDQGMAEFLEIAGIGHELVDIKTDFDDADFAVDANGNQIYTGSLVNVYNLDSRFAFCVYYNGPGQKKVLGVTYSKRGGTNHFTCFTDRQRFEVEAEKLVEVSENPLGMIPIVEFERSFDRMGCFEHCISEMDGLNILVSDFANGVAQNTQSIWWGDNLDMPEGTPPKSGQWLLTNSDNQSGRVAKVQPLSINTDSGGVLNAINAQRTWILQKCHVPIQYDSSGGGSTGVAMDIASGWSDSEVAAMQKQQMVDKAKREELTLILRAIRLVPESVLPHDNPIRNVHVSDVDFHYTRKRNYDLATKSNFIATMLNNGFKMEHVLVAADVFNDNAQVCEDSREMVEAIQRSKITSGETTETERLFPDTSDQAGNSPLIDGMNTDNA